MYKTILVTTLVCTLFLGVTYLHANWSEPSANPPNGNIAVPVNTGSVNQDKEGGLGADTLAAYDAFNFVFKNTSADDWTAWRLVRNDGTGNFHTYLNSKGSKNPVHETDGHSFHEEYNPGNGVYKFSTSNGSGPADSSIAWQNAFKIFPDGRVGAQQYCDIDGKNCDSGGAGGGGADLEIIYNGQCKGSLANCRAKFGPFSGGERVTDTENAAKPGVYTVRSAYVGNGGTIDGLCTVSIGDANGTWIPIGSYGSDSGSAFKKFSFIQFPTGEILPIDGRFNAVRSGVWDGKLRVGGGGTCSIAPGPIIVYREG